MKAYLSVARQVPEFVRAEYPAFLEFLKAYYQWYEEQYSVGKVGDVTSLDSTPAGFVKYFRKQLDVYGITANIDNRMFLEHIKELYAAKGSAAGIEFLFKIIFNKPSNVLQPWDYVFKPSEGKWTQDTSILVEHVENIDAILNTSIIVSDDAGREYKAYVRAVIHRPDDSVEIFVSRFAPLSTLVQIRSIDGSIATNIVKAYGRYEILDSGANFRIGQVYSTGAGDTVYKVKAVTSTGGIKALEILTFGRSYGFAMADVSLDNPVDIISPAHILFYPETLLVYPGYYVDSTNIIGDLVYIQDSYYYQIHSYVTVVEESLEAYGALLQQVLHPAGTKQFATLQLNNSFQLDISVDPQLNLIAKADALRDFITTSVALPVFEVSKPLIDTASAADIIQITSAFIRSFADQATVTEALSFTPIKALTDSVAVTDVIEIIPGIGLVDSIIISDTSSFIVDKYLSDIAQTSNTGAIFGTPFYTDVPAEQYWEAGYIENERAITN